MTTATRGLPGQQEAEGGVELTDEELAVVQGRLAKAFGAAVPLLKEGETLTSGPEGKSGIWRSIGGNPVFISVDTAAGESIPEAVRREVGKKGGAVGVAGTGRPVQGVSPDILKPGGTGMVERDLGTVLAETPDAATRKAMVDADRSLTPAQKAALVDTELKHDHLPGEGAQRWLKDRQGLHERLLSEVEGTYAPSPERQAQRNAGARPELVMLMGGPGAGKTTVLNQFMKDRIGDFLKINPDDFKTKLPEYGTIAGDDAVWRAASQTTHEESSYLSKALLARGFGRKADMIFDGTLGNVDKAMAMVEKAKSLGYRVSLHYIDAPMDVGLARIKTRGEGGEKSLRRYVPESFARESYGKMDASFERLRKLDAVDAWAWYKVPTVSSNAERMARGGREFPKSITKETPEGEMQSIGIGTLTRKGAAHG